MAPLPQLQLPLLGLGSGPPVLLVPHLLLNALLDGGEKGKDEDEGE